MGFEILLTVLFVLLLVNFFILDCTVSKMKKDRLNLYVVTAITALEMAVKKLNEALRINDRRLDNHLHEISDIKNRLDILENGHPDSDIDYCEVDDDNNVVAVWFEGKKYVPEDKRDENTSTFYADNKVVAEITKPDVKCCSTCKHYRPDSGYSTCEFSSWLHVTKKCATMTDSACHNYEKAYAATKGEVDHLYTQYKNMGGNGRAEELPKYIVKLNYLASDTECDELLKCVERLNRIYDAGLLSLSEYGDRLKELMQNDS